MRLADAWRMAFAPVDRRPTPDYAAEFLTLPKVLAKDGRYDKNFSPHFNAPLAALLQDTVREVNVLAPPRSGKSLIGDLDITRSMATEAATILLIHAVDDMAKSHAELRLMPIFKSDPKIRSLLPENTDRIRNQEVILTDGRPLVVSGTSLSKLQARGFMRVYCDELWQWEDGRLAEARARVGDFLKIGLSKVVCISQGGFPESEWEMQFRGGVLHELTVPCLSCGRYMLLPWRGEKDERKFGIRFKAAADESQSDILEAEQTVRYVCPNCGYEHPDTDTTRRTWVMRSRYTREPNNPELPEALAPYPVRSSFRWPAVLDYPWSHLVRLWLEAQRAKRAGSYEPLVKFTQKYFPAFASEHTLGEIDATFKKHAELEPTEKLPDEVARFLTVDRQREDLFWVTARAWAKDGRSWRLHFGRCYGFAEVEELRIRLGITPRSTVIDSGYVPKGDNGVYAACARYGWIAAKGDDAPNFAHHTKDAQGKTVRTLKPWAPVTYADPGEGTSAQGRVKCLLFRFSAPAMARRVRGLIRSGLWREPDTDATANEMEREYHSQMSAEFEKIMVNPKTGRREPVWVCPSGNNHAFDCSKMQALAAMHKGFLPGEDGL
jgi:phage terminase large subunit GpA-like protein